MTGSLGPPPPPSLPPSLPRCPAANQPLRSHGPVDLGEGTKRESEEGRRGRGDPAPFVPPAPRWDPDKVPGGCLRLIGPGWSLGSVAGSAGRSRRSAAFQPAVQLFSPWWGCPLGDPGSRLPWGSASLRPGWLLLPPSLPLGLPWVPGLIAPWSRIHRPFKGARRSGPGGNPGEQRIQPPKGIPDPSVQVRRPSAEAPRERPAGAGEVDLGEREGGSFRASSRSSFLGEPPPQRVGGRAETLVLGEGNGGDRLSEGEGGREGASQQRGTLLEERGNGSREGVQGGGPGKESRKRVWEKDPGRGSRKGVQKRGPGSRKGVKEEGLGKGSRKNVLECPKKGVKNGGPGRGSRKGVQEEGPERGSREGVWKRGPEKGSRKRVWERDPGRMSQRGPKKGVKDWDPGRASRKRVQGGGLGKGSRKGGPGRESRKRWGTSGRGSLSFGSSSFAVHAATPEIGAVRLVRKWLEASEGLIRGSSWKVVVVDTPGFFDPGVPESQTVAELGKCMTFCTLGPHAILCVMRPGRFSQEEKETLRLVKELFGHQGKNYMILLFTRKEDLEGETLEEFISKGNVALRELVAQCGHRCLAFNNEAEGEEREAQVAELMRMIDQLVYKNGDATCYTEDMLTADINHFKERRGLSSCRLL
ncbi:GTPase IMAP family member 7-like [Crotalus adamanteus]|uniref:GTPase IMAP family member 7-like n=1 Tax=Crotalus adamanteus TaxID=8729 RepID=A0AAW1B349_CROAD